jgi:hypothetical protein
MNLVVIARHNNATATVAHVVSSFCDAVGWTCSLAMGVTVALESIGSWLGSFKGVTVGGHPVTRLVRASKSYVKELYNKNCSISMFQYQLGKISKVSKLENT